CNDMAKSSVALNADEIILFYVNNVHHCFLSKISWQEVGRGMADKIFKNSRLVSKLIKEQNHFGKRLVEFTSLAHKMALDKLSNEELFGLYAGFEEKYKQVYLRYGWIWIAEDFIQEDLLKLINDKVKDFNQSAMIVDILTKEPGAMVAQEERLALLKMALKAKNHGIKDKLIERHVADYYWVTRDYEDPVLDFNSVLKRLKDYLSTDFEKELADLLAGLKNDEEKRKKYLKELRFSRAEKNYFTSMRQVTYLKELRKRYVSEGLYHFDKVLLEIGRRLFLGLKQVRFMSTLDVKRALLGGEDLTEELNARYRLSLWHSTEGGQTEVVTGKEAEDAFAIMCKVDKNATEFTGMPVSPGVARGPVRIIINPDECDKVQMGDVIVSIQVVPSFSTAIMKAAALVCDGGHGITTHPATLAREAGIPGVIQTRFAREALKDGDIVEVDGNRGVVKKISNSPNV
ncbi:MAG: PEP-utilizing enzyme, partial [Patescibacteria group bacterium]